MTEFWMNPVAWVLIFSVFSALAGTIWWASAIHTKVEWLTDTVAEIREDVKKILGRLPPPDTVTGIVLSNSQTLD